MDLWLKFVLVAGCALVAGGAAYWLARDRAARLVAGAVLGAARQVVADYLTEHPPDAAALAGIVAAGYYRLPAAVQARVPFATFTQLVTPLLYQAEEALTTPPPAAARALTPEPGPAAARRVRAAQDAFIARDCPPESEAVDG